MSTFRSVALLLALALSFLLGLRAGRKTAGNAGISALPAQADTLIIRDTIVVKRPVYVTKTRIERVTDTLYIKGDTVRVAVEVPISHERADYESASVWYHGYRAGIDSLAVYPETRVITRTVAPKWSVGLTAGYGASKDGLSPFVGVGVSYAIFSF